MSNFEINDDFFPKETFEYFCHGYFIRENYIKMLISITSNFICFFRLFTGKKIGNLLEKFNGVAMKKEEETNEIESFFIKSKEEFMLMKLNLSEYKVNFFCFWSKIKKKLKEAYERSEDLNKKLFEEIQKFEKENENLKEELMNNKEKLLDFCEIQQKFNVNFI